MARVASDTVAGKLAVAAAQPRTSLWQESARRFRRHRLAMVGSVILLALVLAVVFGPLVWRLPINDIDFKAKLKGPSWNHPLGTDDLGQDVLARMLYGGRISLAVGIAAMLIAISIGTAVGAISGFYGGVVDHALMRVTDMFLAAAGLTAPAADRLPLPRLAPEDVRAGGRRLHPDRRGDRRPALDAGRPAGARAVLVACAKRNSWSRRGASAPAPLRQVVRHILPNAMGPVIVAGTIDVAAAIIAESTLSFLGLGFPPDIPTWGRILFDAKDNLDFAPHWAIFPGTAIFLTVLSINYIGDGLRDAFDPRKVLGK